MKTPRRSARLLLAKALVLVLAIAAPDPLVAQPAPVTIGDLHDMLRAGVSPARIVSLVREQCWLWKPNEVERTYLAALGRSFTLAQIRTLKASCAKDVRESRDVLAGSVTLSGIRLLSPEFPQRVEQGSTIIVVPSATALRSENVVYFSVDQNYVIDSIPKENDIDLWERFTRSLTCMLNGQPTLALFEEDIPGDVEPEVMLALWNGERVTRSVGGRLAIWFAIERPKAALDWTTSIDVACEGDRAGTTIRLARSFPLPPPAEGSVPSGSGAAFRVCGYGSRDGCQLEQREFEVGTLNGYFVNQGDSLPPQAQGLARTVYASGNQFAFEPVDRRVGLEASIYSVDDAMLPLQHGLYATCNLHTTGFTTGIEGGGRQALPRITQDGNARVLHNVPIGTYEWRLPNESSLSSKRASSGSLVEGPSELAVVVCGAGGKHLGSDLVWLRGRVQVK